MKLSEEMAKYNQIDAFRHLGKWAKQVAQLPSVEEATRSNGRMKIKTHRAQQALIEFLEISNQRDVRITSLEILEPNLESVFLHLTGKKLRQ